MMYAMLTQEAQTGKNNKYASVFFYHVSVVVFAISRALTFYGVTRGSSRECPAGTPLMGCWKNTRPAC